MLMLLLLPPPPLSTTFLILIRWLVGEACRYFLVESGRVDAVAAADTAVVTGIIIRHLLTTILLFVRFFCSCLSWIPIVDRQQNHCQGYLMSSPSLFWATLLCPPRCRRPSPSPDDDACFCRLCEWWPLLNSTNKAPIAAAARFRRYLSWCMMMIF